MFRRTNTFLINCYNVSHKIASTPSSCQLIPVRFIRVRNPGEDSKADQQQSGSSSSKKQSGEEEGPNKFNMPPLPPNVKMIRIDRKQIRKMGVIFLITFGVSTVLTYVTLRRFSSFDRNGISFDEFVQNFLKTGEVKEITYFPNSNVAIAQLHEGAIVNGKPFEKPSVVVKFDGAMSDRPDQFEAEIRRIEKQLKIESKDALPIMVLPGISGIKMVEFMLGLGILLFLLIGYIRLATRKLAQNNAKKAGRPFQKSK